MSAIDPDLMTRLSRSKDILECAIYHGADEGMLDPHEAYAALTSLRRERDDARLLLRACAALKTDVRRGIFHKTNWQWSVPLYRTDKAPKTGPHDFRLVASANGSEDSDVPELTDEARDALRKELGE